MKKIFPIFLMFVCIFASAHVIEFEDSRIDTNFANGKKVVLREESDRIYLNPQSILTTEKGIFVQLDNRNLIALPELFSDNEGCFIPTRSISVTKECPFCGYRRISYAIRCDNEQCPSNQPQSSDE